FGAIRTFFEHRVAGAWGPTAFDRSDRQRLDWATEEEPLMWDLVVRRWSPFVLAAALSLAACSGGTTEAPPPQPAPPPAPMPARRPPPPAPAAAALPEGWNSALLEPSQAHETAPAIYKVKFETTKGPFVVEVHRDWAPMGADRFYNLVKIGYYD